MLANIVLDDFKSEIIVQSNIRFLVMNIIQGKTSLYLENFFQLDKWTHAVKKLRIWEF